MDLFDKNGSYQFMAFKGKSGDWYLQGTSTNYANVRLPYVNGISEEILKCIDTFKNKKGEYLEIMRYKVMEEARKGLITPLEESRVIVKQYSKKDDKLRRAV